MNRNVPLYIQQFQPFHDPDTDPGDLAPDAIHIWWALLDLPDSRNATLAATLNAEETTRADRLGGTRRQRFIATRGILRMLLGRYLDQRPEAVPCGRDPSGKPRLTDPEVLPKMHFSLSHSNEMALFGFCPNRIIGVDIEQIRPVDNWEAIAERLFSTAERMALREAEPSRRPTLFFRLWTMKEAWVKATGEGLGGLRGIEIPGGHAAGDHGDGECLTDRSGRSWMIRTVTVAAGYAAAVAVTADPRNRS